MVCRKIFIPVMGLALAGMACATTTFYTSQSLFNADTSGLTFQTISDLLQSQTSGGAGLIDPATGVTFTDQDGFSSRLTVVDPSTLKINSGFVMGISVPSTFTAYWFDIVTLSPGSNVSESSSSPSSFNGFVLPAPAGALTFFGIVTDTSVSGLQLSGTGGIEVTNFNVAGAPVGADSPETGTMMMIGGGLILLRALRVRRVRSAG